MEVPPVQVTVFTSMFSPRLSMAPLVTIIVLDWPAARSPTFPEGDRAPGEPLMVAVTSFTLYAVSGPGSGVPEEIRPHLFEPFVSQSSGRERLGLGLAAIHHIPGPDTELEQWIGLCR